MDGALHLWFETFWLINCESLTDWMNAGKWTSVATVLVGIFFPAALSDWWWQASYFCHIIDRNVPFSWDMMQLQISVLSSKTNESKVVRRWAARRKIKFYFSCTATDECSWNCLNWFNCNATFDLLQQNRCLACFAYAHLHKMLIRHVLDSSSSWANLQMLIRNRYSKAQKSSQKSTFHAVVCVPL